MMLGLSPSVWLAVGFCGQGIFTARFLVQWLASEKRKESVVPVSFWWLSLSGSAILVLYAASKGDPVFLLSTLINGFLYARNLILIHVRQVKPGPRRVLVPITLAVGAFVLYGSWRGLDPAAISAPGRVVILVGGFLGAACWSGRFLIQWYASERAGKSVMPRAFWYVGLLGAVLLLAYSVARKDPVFILGFLFPPFPYIRNLVLIYRKEGAPAAVVRAEKIWRGRRSRGVAILVFSILLAAFLAAKVLTSKAPAGDFLRYHRAGRIVATGNAEHLYDRQPFFKAYEDPAWNRKRMKQQFRYLPSFAVLMAPIGALPVKVAEVIWAWLNAFCFLMLLAVSWWMCRRYGVRAAWMWVPLLLLVRFGWDNVNLGQINPTIILCATAGIYLAETRRPARGGLLVALGGVIKFTPLLVLLIFAVRGQWRALASGLAGVVILAAVLPSAVLGPETAVRLNRSVWEQQGTHLLTREKQPDVPGESLRAISYRILGPLALKSKRGRVDVSLGLLTEKQALWAYRSLTLLMLAGLLVFAVRRRDDLRAPLVWGATLAVGLMISPETRQPHFQILALPATAVVMVAARSGYGSARGKALVAIMALVFALAALPSRGIVGARASQMFGAYCAAGVATLLLLVAVILASGLLPAGGGPRPGTDEVPGTGLSS